MTKRGIFVARYRADLVGATYSAQFHDGIIAGIALHNIAKMLGLKWGLRRAELVLEGEALRFRSRAVVDALPSGSVESPPAVWSQAG